MNLSSEMNTPTGISIALALFWAMPVVVAEPLYSVVPIPPPAIGDTRNAGGSAINDFGQVMGAYGVFDSMGNQTGIRTFHYSDGVGTVDIPAPQIWNLFAGGINNSGQMAVYGAERGPGAQFRAYRYSQASGFQPLGTFGGTQTEAAAINNSGQVTGFSSSADGRSYAYRYTDGIGLESIGTAFNNSEGYGINDRGWVAGYADGNAVLFRDEGDVVLLPGVARGINNPGDVVGNTTIVPGHPTAFVYLNGQMLILGDSVFSQTILYDINNQGLAVGAGYLDGSPRAVLWSEAQLGGQNAGLVDLNMLLPENSGWTLLGAGAINEAGQITGAGFFNGELLGFRLDPVPEPSTWALFVLGFCLVMLVEKAGKRTSGKLHGWLAALPLLCVPFLTHHASAAWPASYDGAPAEIVADSLGNVYIAATASNGTNLDLITIKYDWNGDQQWLARYDGPNQGDDYAVALCVDGTGDVIVAGQSQGDIAVIKYDSTGHQVWAFRYDSPAGYDRPAGIVADMQGQIFVTGNTYNGNNSWVTICLQPSGLPAWTNYVQGIGWEWLAKSIALVPAGGVYVSGTGSSSETNWTEAFGTIRYCGDGTALWTNWFPGEGGSMAVDRQGHALVATYSRIIKYTPDAQVVWTRSFPGALAEAIAVDTAGNIFVAGWGGQVIGEDDILVAKYDAAGSELWAHSQWFGFEDCFLSGFAVDSAGNAHLCGDGRWYGSQIHYGGIVARYDPGGNLALAAGFGTVWPDNAPPRALAVDAAGNAFALGFGLVDRFLQQPFAPELSINKVGGEVLLSWTALATNVVLESSYDLANALSWQALTNPPAIVDGQNIVTNRMESAAQFFRLRAP